PAEYRFDVTGGGDGRWNEEDDDEDDDGGWIPPVVVVLLAAMQCHTPNNKGTHHRRKGEKKSVRRPEDKGRIDTESQSPVGSTIWRKLILWNYGHINGTNSGN